jgi:tRNA modification GTPase
MPALLAALRHQAAALAHPGAAAAFGRARHVAALRDAVSSLDAALSEHRPELRAEELRGALRALGRLTGEVASEAILDVVFGAFCIGK